MVRNWCTKATGMVMGGATALLLSAASPGDARAAEGWAEIAWNWRWGSGSIVYDRDITPVDPQDGGGTFRDSIGPFRMVGWDMLTPVYFEGVGGTMTTRNYDLPGCDPTDVCDMISVRIDFGPMSNGDPARWRLDLTARGRLDSHGLPALGSGSESGGAQFDGYLSNNLDGRRYGALDSFFGNTHYLVAKPVPEPASVALMTLGLVGVGVMARRRRATSPG